MFKGSRIRPFTLGIVAIFGWVAAGTLVFSAGVASNIQEFIFQNSWLAATAAALGAAAVFLLIVSVVRNTAGPEVVTQEARIGYLRDRLETTTGLITELKGQIARHETARGHMVPMMPEGFMSEIDREIIDGNIEREVALAERYVETHSEALLRAFNTLARAALMEEQIDEEQIECRRAVGYALGALAVYRGDDAARDLSRKLIPIVTVERSAA